MDIKLRLALEDEMDNLKCDLEFYGNQIEGAEKHLHNLRNTMRDIKTRYDAVEALLALYKEDTCDEPGVDG